MTVVTTRKIFKYNEVDGNLITLARKGEFDVIVHGCNCFCKMKRGIAPQMAAAFGCDKFLLEGKQYEGDINKLGNIDFQNTLISERDSVTVVNAYTQYNWSTETKPFDYQAFQLCLRKINHLFQGKHIGLPKIGSHLAGGDWERIKSIIQTELNNCDITVVTFIL